jgi:hypothetical protein
MLQIVAWVPLLRIPSRWLVRRFWCSGRGSRVDVGTFKEKEYSIGNDYVLWDHVLFKRRDRKPHAEMLYVAEANL